MLPDARAPDPSLRSAKQALRGRILSLRDELAPAARADASCAIVERIVALLSFECATTVLLTLPYGSEWDTRPIALRALRAGKTLAVPRVDHLARVLVPHAIADLDRDIVPGYLTIPEPRAELPPVDPVSIDWVLVPGVAFDTDGRRLGYGGGYYDRLLPMLGEGVPRIVGAYDLQIVDEVPAGAYDRRVDCIVTESRVIEISRSR